MENDLDWIKSHLNRLEAKIDANHASYETFKLQIMQMHLEALGSIKSSIAVLKTKHGLLATFWGLIGSAIGWLVSRQL